MGAADPVWTESYWNTISLRVYAVQSTTSDWLVLLAGLVVTAVSYLGVIIGRTYISKITKRD
jgi:nicastrin